MKSRLLCILCFVLATAGCSPSPQQETLPAKESSAGARPVGAPEDANAGTRYVYGVVGAIDASRVRLVEAELKRALDAFLAAEGRHPRTLEELVTERYLPALPELPAGVQFEYDHESGTARVVARR